MGPRVFCSTTILFRAPFSLLVQSSFDLVLIPALDMHLNREFEIIMGAAMMGVRGTAM
jgi:hypothetical protein